MDGALDVVVELCRELSDNWYLVGGEDVLAELCQDTKKKYSCVAFFFAEYLIELWQVHIIAIADLWWVSRIQYIH